MSKYDLKKNLESEILYNVSQEIKRRRKFLKLNQKTFANLVRMHPSNYCKFERGLLNISLLQYIEIMDTLDFLEQRNYF